MFYCKSVWVKTQSTSHHMKILLIIKRLNTSVSEREDCWCWRSDRGRNREKSRPMQSLSVWFNINKTQVNLFHPFSIYCLRFSLPQSLFLLCSNPQFFPIISFFFCISLFPLTLVFSRICSYLDPAVCQLALLVFIVGLPQLGLREGGMKVSVNWWIHHAVRPKSSRSQFLELFMLPGI